MKRRICAAILALCLCAAMLPTLSFPTYAATGLTLQELQTKFPAQKNGKNQYWNGGGPKNKNDPDCTTDQPCTVRGDGSHPDAGDPDQGSSPGDNYWCDACQCYGFALKLAYDACGITDQRSWGSAGFTKLTKLSDLDDYLRAGDIIRVGGELYGHSVFVTSVNGDSFTYADCNSDGHCLIRWGVSGKISDVKNGRFHGYSFAYILHAPQELSTCSHAYETVKKSDGTYVARCKKCNSEYQIVVSSDGAGIYKLTTAYTLSSDPYQDAKTNKKLEKGTEVTIIGSTTNAYGSLWYKTSDGYWIFSDYLQFVRALSKYYLNVNGILDGTLQDGTNGYGTFDVYINGKLDANDATDYYKQWTEGTSYKITDLKAASGKSYQGVQRDPLVGTISKYTEVNLVFITGQACSHTYETVKKSDGSYVAQCKKCGSEYKIVVSSDGAGIYKLTTAYTLNTYPYQEAKSSTKLAKGTEVTISGSTKNAYGNLWYKTGDGYWIYPDYLQLQKPKITTQPSDTTVIEGKTATFQVAAIGAKSYQWYYRTSSIASWKQVQNNGASAIYNLATAARHNGYQYRCKVTNASGSVYSSTVKLTLKLKPQITTQPKNVTVIEGKTATFKVVATGATGYQWYYRNGSGDSWHAVQNNGTSVTYSLTTKARHNGYQYRCKITNANGYVYSSIVTLTLKLKPQITTQPKNVTVVTGKTATFKIAATGAKSYQWYYRTSSTGGWRAVQNNGTSATYKLSTLPRHNGYQYRCKVSNDNGYVYSSIVKLTLQ